MLQKNDLLMLLTDLQDNGADVSKQLMRVVKSVDIPVDVVRYINDNRQLDVVSFYELLRKNYNNKKSNLYKNIMKEIEEPDEVITTLCAFTLQVSLFGKNLDNADMFYKHSRVDEVTKVLNSYFTDYDIVSAIKLLKLIKCDILAMEYANNRRDESGTLLKK